MRATRIILVAAVAALVALPGCGGGSESQLTVSAASSLTDAFTRYGDEFHQADTRFSFAGSDVLAAQIQQGARPDVFASANTTYPDDLHHRRLAAKPVVFAANRLVIAVPADDSGIRSVHDLSRPGTTIAIGSASVPIGEYTRQVLSGLGKAQKSSVLDNVASEEPDVAGIVGKLTQGAVDAGFTYVTDVDATHGELEGDRAATTTAAIGRLRGDGDQGDGSHRAGPRVHSRPTGRARRDGAPAGGLRATSEVRASPWFTALMVVALAVTLTFLALPIVAIFVHTGPDELLSSVGDPVAVDALRLSLQTTAASLAIIVVVGTPAAYLLATRDFRGRSLVITLVELPLVLPPAVAGIALLAALGPNGILGGWLDDAGVVLVLQTAGVILALTFVASPFFLRQAQAAFEAVDRRTLEASRTLGSGEARTLLLIAIPAARAGLAAGLALAWGRALGEFGATLMFAGSVRGVTQTVPLAIYDRFATDFPAALALSAVLVAISAALLLTVKLLSRTPAGADAGR